MIGIGLFAREKDVDTGISGKHKAVFLIVAMRASMAMNGIQRIAEVLAIGWRIGQQMWAQRSGH